MREIDGGLKQSLKESDIRSTHRVITRRHATNSKVTILQPYLKLNIRICEAGIWTSEIAPWAELPSKTNKNQNQVVYKMSLSVIACHCTWLRLAVDRYATDVIPIFT